MEYKPFKYTIEDLMKIEGIGYKTAKAFVDHFNDPKNLEKIRELFRLGIRLKEDE